MPVVSETRPFIWGGCVTPMAVQWPFRSEVPITLPCSSTFSAPLPPQSLGVGVLSLPAATAAIPTWVNAFHFQPVEVHILQAVQSELRLLMFPGSKVPPACTAYMMYHMYRMHDVLHVPHVLSLVGNSTAVVQWNIGRGA